MQRLKVRVSSSLGGWIMVTACAHAPAAEAPAEAPTEASATPAQPATVAAPDPDPEASTTKQSVLFDGIRTDGWVQAGPGAFDVQDGYARSRGGMGLWYYSTPFSDFELALEFRQEKLSSNSGVFVRFPRVDGDPWHPVREGYEIQIAGDQPDKTSTGAVYDFQAATHVPIKPPGQWNHYEIRVVGQTYQVKLNGELVNEFTGERALVGMIGLQNHGDADVVDFRNVRVREIPAR